MSGILKAKQTLKKNLAAAGGSSSARAGPAGGAANGARPAAGRVVQSSAAGSTDQDAGEDEEAREGAGADEELGVDSELDDEERADLEAELDDAETVERQLRVEQETAQKAHLEQIMPWMQWTRPQGQGAGGAGGGGAAAAIGSRNPTHLSMAATSGAPDSAGTLASGSGSGAGNAAPGAGAGAADEQLMPLSPMGTSEFDSFASLTRFPIGVGDSLVERCATELSMNAHVVRWTRNEPIERIVQMEGTVRKLAAKKSECALLCAAGGWPLNLLTRTYG